MISWRSGSEQLTTMMGIAGYSGLGCWPISMASSLSDPHSRVIEQRSWFATAEYKLLRAAQEFFQEFLRRSADDGHLRISYSAETLRHIHRHPVKSGKCATQAEIRVEWATRQLLGRTCARTAGATLQTWRQSSARGSSGLRRASSRRISLVFSSRGMGTVILTSTISSPRVPSRVAEGTPFSRRRSFWPH